MASAERRRKNRTWSPVSSHRSARLVTARPLLVLAMLAMLGITLDLSGLIDWQELVAWARVQHPGWIFAMSIILVQGMLFTFGLPGSALVWIAAALYPPLLSTLILSSGGTAGALGAYLFARWQTQHFADRSRGQGLFQLLKSHGDFLTLCALRVMPGMPHSVINYSAGTLRLPLASFLVSSLLGHAIKSLLYSIAIHGALESATLTELLRPGILIPLGLITLLMLLGRIARRRLRRESDGVSRHDSAPGNGA